MPAMLTDTPSRAAAIDFGISNTDVVVRRAGELMTWSQPYAQDPDPASVRELLASRDVDLDALPWLAVTGGRHRVLPDAIGATTVLKINEVQAIGRGGQALLGLDSAGRAAALMVASCGSGTALIKAQGDSYAHVSGSAVGGGTMLGLARLILGTMDPLEIEALAAQGDRNGADAAAESRPSTSRSTTGARNSGASPARAPSRSRRRTRAPWRRSAARHRRATTSAAAFRLTTRSMCG